jgi:hypothetical protein
VIEKAEGIEGNKDYYQGKLPKLQEHANLHFSIDQITYNTEHWVKSIRQFWSFFITFFIVHPQ